jgi:hypothetical protein
MPRALRCDRLGGRGWRVTRHCAGVAEREVDVGVAVEVGHARVLRVIEIERETARSQVHPGHRDAAEQVVLGLLVSLFRTRVRVGEGLALAGEQRSETIAVHAREAYARA